MFYVDNRYSVQKNACYYGSLYCIIDNRYKTEIEGSQFGNRSDAEKICRGLNKIVSVAKDKLGSDAAECIIWLIRR